VSHSRPGGSTGGRAAQGRRAAGDRLAVGLVRGVHGLNGAVRVELLTDRPERFDAGSVLHAEGSAAPLTVTWRQEDGRGLLVRFEEVVDRPGAERLRDRYLEATADEAALDEGEAWWHEVVGTAVTALGGEPLGDVADIFRAGGGEVLVVRGGPHGELLVPAVSAVVREFAPREGRIVVDTDALGLEEERPRRRRGRRSSKEPMA
jgi:16S rRNA processing protein RimM